MRPWGNDPNKEERQWGLEAETAAWCDNLGYKATKWGTSRWIEEQPASNVDVWICKVCARVRGDQLRIWVMRSARVHLFGKWSALNDSCRSYKESVRSEVAPRTRKVDEGWSYLIQSRTTVVNLVGLRNMNACVKILDRERTSAEALTKYL